MSYSEQELEQQEIEIKKILFIVFTPIVIIVAIYVYFQNNSLDYHKKKYEYSHYKAFAGKVIKKKQQDDYPRADRYVILDSYHVERIDQYTYQKIAIGDSVIKRKGQDSVYFYLKNRDVLIEDYNQYDREKYFDLLFKKN